MTELDLSDPDAVQRLAGQLARTTALGDVDMTDAPAVALASMALSLHAAGLYRRTTAAHLEEFDSFVDVRPYPPLVPFDPATAPLGTVVARRDPADLRRWIVADSGPDANSIIWLQINTDWRNRHADTTVTCFIDTSDLPADVVILGPGL